MSGKLIAAVWSGAALLLAPAAHAQTGSPIPAPWQVTDVGAVGTPGDAHEGPNHDWHVSGAGNDIWGTADSFIYVYQPIRDGSIFAGIDTEKDTSPVAKAGVMIRQTLDPGSPEVILDVKPDGGIEFMKRSAQGGDTTFITGASIPVSPDGTGAVNVVLDLQLYRRGNTVFAVYCYSSTCTTIGSTDFPEGPALIGIAVTSHNPSTLNEAFLRTPPTVLSVPFPWGTSDVGHVGTAGDATYEEATGTFSVNGAGSDIWGTADSFRIVSQQLAGDSLVAARVVSEQNTNSFAKAGVTMGADSADGARVILDVKPDGGVEFMARSADGASMAFIAGASASFPIWLRLTRDGNNFTGEISSDGQTWTSIGSIPVTMPAKIAGGFAVTSHAPGVLNLALFDNIAVTTELPLGPTGPNLLVNGGFENSVVPGTGPGWVSDTPLRGSPAVAETALPHTGTQNGACRTTSQDCGIYQDVSGSSGNLLFSVYARADHPGAFLGVNVDGHAVTGTPVFVGGYQRYTVGFCTCSVTSSAAVIRVWIYAPATAGVVAIDDAELVEDFGPR
jgi:hypothetical protein